MTTRQLKCLWHKSYTIGWICALPVEMAAAKAMLDERHQKLSQPAHDTNNYVLGDIFGHNVVITCLPSGEYGTNASATVSTHLQSTFQQIEFILMVGIGGGVPSTADIRLGDVVVSSPTGQYGGVVQYDYGKTMANGRFVHTGMLNKPPQKLLTAVAELRSEHMMGANRISEFLLELETKFPAMSDFLYPDSTTDLLFRAKYDHRELEQSCDACDKSMLVIRKPRPSNSPKVHYGLIASGNQVMKDASSRDRLAKEYGIMCFDMEAAGLMNNSPCLVVRGICDYADSHKRKEWQSYAAATAAAYTKELLALITPHTLDDYAQSASTSNDEILDEASLFLSISQRPEWHLTRQVQNAPQHIFDRLSGYDPHHTCRSYLQKRCPNTTSWILNNSTFKAWIGRSSNPCLWLTGKIGCGKSIVTSTVIEFIEAAHQDSTTFVAHFFYSHSNHSRLKARDLAESYTKQILGYLSRIGKSCPSEVVKNLKRLYGLAKYPTSMKELVEDVLLRACRDVPDAVDGLDECERSEVLQVFDIFRVMISWNRCRVLISGREGLDVTQAIPSSVTITIANQGNGNDILRFIDWKIKEKSRDRQLTENITLLDNIRYSLLDRADRMFLWVNLQLDLLWEECYTDAEIQNSLENLPKDLGETYDRCLSRIKGRSSGIAQKILSWICVAIQPFGVSQMQEALAMDPRTGLIDVHNILPVKEILKMCSHLVIQETDDTLRLTHYSVNQFLREKSAKGDLFESSQSLTDSRTKLGELCISHLLSPIYVHALERRSKEATTTDISPVLRIIQKNMPYSHLLRFKKPRSVQVPWPPRLRPATKTDLPAFYQFAKDQWAPLMDNIEISSAFWGKFRTLAIGQHFTFQVHPWEPIGQSVDSHFLGLLGWAIANHHIPLFSLISDPDKPRLKADIFNIPLYHYNNIPLLHLAARMNFVPAVYELTKVCKSRLLDHVNRSPLHHAAEMGSIESVRVLLGRTTDYGEPEAPIIKKAYNKPGDINSIDLDGYAALHLAAKNDHREIVDLLCASQAKVDLQGKKLRTALFLAVQNGNTGTVQTLIEWGAYVDARDEENYTPLFVAAIWLKTDIVHLLIDRGADVNACDEDSFRALHFASANFSPKLFDDGFEALDRAVQTENEVAVDCLLRLGANPNGKMSYSHLTRAVEIGNCRIVKLLVESGATINRRDYHDKTTTALKVAYRHKREDIISFLESRGAIM